MTTELQSTILVVDDEFLNRSLLAASLGDAGHRVVLAENGREALEQIELEAPDLVLLDIVMPEMDGFEVLEALKRHEQWQRLPVVMISAVDELESVVRCIALGAEDHLPKPFEPTLLRARIDACLEKKRLQDRERELFAQLQENYARLQALEKQRDDLTHMIVHDLRTPLTGITTGLQTAKLMGELNDDQLEFVDMAIDSGQVLLSMINDLLDISKMEDGSLKLEREDLSPAAVVQQALQQVEALAREKNLTLSGEVEPGVATISADEEKLRRTLVNLLGNALKFTPDGGRVTLNVSLSDGDVRFAVADTGEGIPAAELERVFDKFGQVESRKSGRKMSTGLGLTFCKLATEAHGGRIWVESELGRGSTFVVSLPAGRPD